MSSRGWLNLALLLAVAGLMAVAVLEPGIDSAPPARLTRFQPADLKRLTLKQHGQPDVVLTRRDHDHRPDHRPGQWWMEKPFRAPAGRYLQQTLTELLAAQPSAAYNSTELDLTAVGLAPPAASISLNDEPLLVGTVDPVHGSRYMLVGEQVLLVPDYLASALLVPATELLSHQLLPPQSHIRELRLPAPAAPEQATVKVRTLTRAQGRLRLTPDSGLSADQLRAWLDEWLYAQALDLSTYPPDDYPESPETIEITLESGRQMLFDVLTPSQDEWVLASRSAGLKYHFARQQAQRLLHPTRNAAAD